MLSIEHLRASDLAEIQLQASQRMQLGQVVAFSDEEAEALAAQTEAWTVRVDGRAVCCMAIAETFPGRQGVAMALLAEGIGPSHLAITRFARERVALARVDRVEAIALANDAECILERFPHLDPWELLVSVMVEPTPQCRWALAIGMQPVAVLRKFGGAAETHVLFERIR